MSDQKIVSNTFLFSNGWCPLSTFNIENFYMHGHKFSSMQQAIEATKALEKNNMVLFKQIMATYAPSRLKKLVPPEDPEVNNLQEVIEKVVNAKFVKGSKSAKFLLDTDDLQIVFATKFDPYMGSGLEIHNDQNLDSFPGKNVLGKVLMKKREMLKVAELK